MKRTFKSIMFVAAAAMAFSACNVEPIETAEEITGTHKVTFVASQVETKTTMEINNGIASFAWENTDKAYFHIFENGVGATGDDIDAELDNGIMNISAIFPNSSAPYTYTGFMAATVSNDNPAVCNEQIDLGAYDPESDILVAKPVTDKAPEDIVEGILFQFKRVVAINQMTLKGLAAGETVEDVTITSDKPIAGEYDFINGVWNASGTSISIDAEAVANANGQAVVYFVSAPVEDAQLTITATTAADKTYSKELAKTITFNEGGVKAFGVTVEENSPVPPTPVELFYESFDKNDGTGGNDGSWSGTIATNNLIFDNPDWECSNGYGADQCAKFGTGSKQGSAITPALGINGDATISFRAGAWNKDATILYLSVVGEGSLDVEYVNIENNKFSDYSVTISGANADSKVKFLAKQASSSRFFLDEVRVIVAAPDTRTVLSTPTNLAVDASTKIVSWTAVENAGSYLVTIGDNETVSTTTNSYDATAIADEYYDVSVIAVPTDTDTYKNSAAATLEGARFGDPWLTTPVLHEGTIDESSITVTWTNDSRATNGYEAIILKDMGDGTCRDLTTEDHDQMNIISGSATFTGLEEGQAYEIRVMAMTVTEPRAYHFSSNGTINLSTKAPQHVSDISATGTTYTIKNLIVYAVANSYTAVLGDETGFVLINIDAKHNMVVGNKCNVSGSVEKSNGVWQFKNPNLTVDDADPIAVNHPTPIEATETYLESYESAPVIAYVHATGTQDGRNVSVGNKVLYLNPANPSTDGKAVEVTGYLYGYSSQYNNNYIATSSIQEDTNVPSLSVDKDSKEWAWDNTDEFVVNVSANAGSWTISPETLTWATVTANTTANTLTITPNGTNTSGADYESTITISHSVDASLTKTITLKQTKESEVSTWIRVTTLEQLTSGGTFIIGYEATANSGVIVPMRNEGTATTSGVGIINSGTSSGQSTNGTINMSNVSVTTDYEITVVPSTKVSGAICIKIGSNFLGNTNTKNNCKLFEFEQESGTTAFGVTIGENDVVTLKIAANETYTTLQYNTGSPRFAVYSGTQKNVVFYKKTN